MKINHVVMKLTRMGFRFRLDGEVVKVRFQGKVRPEPSQVLPLLDTLKQRKPEVQAYLSGLAQTILSCNVCPWCLDNPWSHYPDLPKWCAWWWDYLAANSGWCRDRREGRVPDPEPGKSDVGPLTLPRKETTEVAPTCSECEFFDAGASSPNPTQAWGFCRKLGKGRYGVARACDAWVAPKEATKACST